MKPDRLPQGVRAAWLRTWPNDPPLTDAWFFVGKERYPSKWTIAEMYEKGFCYRGVAGRLGFRAKVVGIHHDPPMGPAGLGTWEISATEIA